MKSVLNERNIRIFYNVIVARVPIRVVASREGVSHVRISQLIRRMARAIAELSGLPAGEKHPGIHAMRLANSAWWDLLLKVIDTHAIEVEVARV